MCMQSELLFILALCPNETTVQCTVVFFKTLGHNYISQKAKQVVATIQVT